MKVVGLILNRNCPELGDSVYEKISHLCDQTFMLENGSSPENISKYSNIFEEDTKGVSWGVNKLFRHALDNTEADVFWLNFNDVGFDCNPEEFLSESLEKIQKDKTIGIVTGWWIPTWDLDGIKNSRHFNEKRDTLVSFFDPLSFFITRECLNKISEKSKKLTPFYDSSNFTNHYNCLAPALTMYLNGLKIVTCKKFKLHEVNIFLEEDKEEKSLEIRGFSDDYWKHTLGPKATKEWLSSFFNFDLPENYGVKQQRNFVINEICKIAKKWI